MIRDKTVSKRIHFFSRCKQIHFSCVFYVFFSWDFQENDVTLIFFWRVYGAWMVSSPGLGLDLTHVRVFVSCMTSFGSICRVYGAWMTSFGDLWCVYGT